MVLLAGFQCLLHRYSGHEDIGIASCAAKPLLDRSRGLIGRFGNDILLRTSLAGQPTFRELLNAYERLRFVRTHTRICHLECQW